MPVTPGAMRSEMCEAVTPADVGGLRCKWCGKPATPRRILGYARSTITAVRTLRTRIRLRLRRIRLHKLLPIQCALLTGIPNLVPPLGFLRCRNTPQRAVFTTLQGAFSPQLLPCIELLLPLRLQIGPGLRVRHVCPGLRARRILLCLRGRRELTLAFCTQLLSLDVALLLNMPLLLLNVAVDHRRRLVALRGRKIWPRPVRRRRARDVRCRHLRGLRSCNLRPCDLRWCGARCHLRRGAGCHLWRRWPRGRGRGSCRRGVWCRTGFSSGILCSSCHRNRDGQRGGQRHSSTQNHHRPSSTSAELKFRHSTG